jgi:hypothetical protein
MPLPLRRRTPLFGRFFIAGKMEVLGPVVLSHVIDISFTRFSHPHDPKWDLFETNLRAGMPLDYITIPRRRRCLRPNGVIAPIDKPVSISRKVDPWILRYPYLSPFLQHYLWTGGLFNDLRYVMLLRNRRWRIAEFGEVTSNRAC